MSSRHFDQLVASGQPVGEVVAVEHFLIRLSGLQPVNVNALVVFEDGTKGYVHHIGENYVTVLHLGRSRIRAGMVAVVQHDQLVAKVGKDFVGRVVSVTGDPLDGKGPIAADAALPVFGPATKLYERELLNTQLETGVTVVDTLFPLLRGQRLAILGDGKSGKSTLATQIALNQKNSDVVVIYVLIAKRQSDVNTLITHLQNNDVLKKAIVVVSTVADSLIMCHLAPYVACSMGEFLWQQQNQDVLIIYDDLTAHAHIYREIALLSGVSPGRDSFPGDIFYAHASLLERAGKLKSNHKTLTAIPLVFAPGGDVTAFLPTNIMSITDGQWILDMKVFRDTMRPAVNIGLSVSRVGGRAQLPRQKQLAGRMFKTLTAYSQAQEFAHFGSGLAVAAQLDLVRGGYLYSVLNQIPGERYSVVEQMLLLDIVLNLEENETLNIDQLKKSVQAQATQIKQESDFEPIRDSLKSLSLMGAKKPVRGAQNGV